MQPRILDDLRWTKSDVRALLSWLWLLAFAGSSVAAGLWMLWPTIVLFAVAGILTAILSKDSVGYSLPSGSLLLAIWLAYSLSAWGIHSLYVQLR